MRISDWSSDVCSSDLRADGRPAQTDDHNRLRLDDWELRDDVQMPCKVLWPQITTENLFELTDYASYKQEFLKLFGFTRSDIDYDDDVDPVVRFDCIELTPIGRASCRERVCQNV